MSELAGQTGQFGNSMHFLDGLVGRGVIKNPDSRYKLTSLGG